MAVSYFENRVLKCCRCAAEFDAKVCLVLHAAANFTQFARLVKDVCHDFLCTNCNLPKRISVSFLIVNPSSSPSLIFCPATEASPDEALSEKERLLRIFREEITDDVPTRQVQAEEPRTLTTEMLRRILPKPAQDARGKDFLALINTFRNAQIHGKLSVFLAVNEPQLATLTCIFKQLATEIIKPELPQNPEIVFEVQWIGGILMRCEEIGITAACLERQTGRFTSPPADQNAVSFLGD